jgi:hypothetical protein
LCFCAAACRISKDVEVVVDPAGAPAGASTAAAALSVEAAGKGSKKQVGKTQDDEKKKSEEPEVKVSGGVVDGLGFHARRWLQSSCVYVLVYVVGKRCFFNVGPPTFSVTREKSTQTRIRSN